MFTSSQPLSKGHAAPLGRAHKNTIVQAIMAGKDSRKLN